MPSVEFDVMEITPALSPKTDKALVGLLVPIPTLLLVASTTSVVVSTVKPFVTSKAPGVTRSPDNLAEVTLASAGIFTAVGWIVMASTAEPLGGAVENVKVVPETL